ncbi:unnamed protein product [Fusarium graminearum]|nr:unnamed protein product [Fusarium graminearum]CAF3644577.1 unnamed protein product [Fusarium graminearum]
MGDFETISYNDREETISDPDKCDESDSAVYRTKNYDKYWNMFYMNDQLHSWWPRALFGLRCLCVRPPDLQNLDAETSEDQQLVVQI